MAVIYRIRNTQTGKCYIGETKYVDPYTRWNQHVNNAKRGKGCPALRDAIGKYGVESFVFEILLFCFDEDRFKYEIEYIAKYNTMVPNGYNLTKGGEGGGFYGKKHTKETVEKIKASLKETCLTEEYKQKMRENAIEMYKCPEMRKKTSEGVKNSELYRKAQAEGRVGASGRNFEITPEMKTKISESLKKYFSTHSGTNATLKNIESQWRMLLVKKSINMLWMEHLFKCLKV